VLVATVNLAHDARVATDKRQHTALG